MDSMRRITVCGGGNGAHAMVGFLLAKGGVEVTLYLSLEPEFRAFDRVKRRGEPFRLAFKGEASELSLAGLAVTRDPRQAGDADLTVLVAPAFAHYGMLDGLAAHLRPGSIVAAMPARGGFEYEAMDALARHGREDITIAGFQTLPWACRIREYARGVDVFGRKRSVGFAVMPSRRGDAIAATLGALLDTELTQLDNMLELTLGNPGQIIHPGIMVGAFAERLDETFSEDDAPLFYASVDDPTAGILDRMSREILAVKERIEALSGLRLPGVVHISEWLAASYGDDIEDKSSLARMFQTNRSYQGLRAPVRRLDDGRLRIDTRARYVSEDVPYGLVVSRAIAELAGAPTPEIDRVIRRTGEWLGMEFLTDSGVSEEVVAKARTPQSRGLRSLEELVAAVARAG